MIYSAACKYFQRPLEWNAVDELPVVNPVDSSIFHADDVSENIRKAVLGCYDVREDDARLRAILSLPPEDRPAYFDRLRKEYPIRREFQTQKIIGAGMDESTQTALRGLGFIC